jgi:hypothetical protein
MADMVQNALRRKLAAAQAVGDLDRINLLRGMMGLRAEVPAEPVPVEVPAEVPEIFEPKLPQPEPEVSWLDDTEDRDE